MLIAILVASVSGMAFSVLLAFAAINLKADQTIGGTALNILRRLCCSTYLGYPGSGPDNNSDSELDPHPGNFRAGKRRKYFLQCLIFKYFLFDDADCRYPVYRTWMLLYKTRFGKAQGLRRASPQAADSVGINVYKMRYAGVLISGFPGRYRWYCLYDCRGQRFCIECRRVRLPLPWPL